MQPNERTEENPEKEAMQSFETIAKKYQDLKEKW